MLVNNFIQKDDPDSEVTAEGEEVRSCFLFFIVFTSSQSRDLGVRYKSALKVAFLAQSRTISRVQSEVRRQGNSAVYLETCEADFFLFSLQASHFHSLTFTKYFRNGKSSSSWSWALCFTNCICMEIRFVATRDISVGCSKCECSPPCSALPI